MEKKFWQKSVVYQIYPRSFKDTNNDGIGDLKGIISKLDYLQNLGIDMIWLCPVYSSPNDDNGYDVSDYYNIIEEYGTMADMEQLIKEAKERNIGIMMDIVANHTSDEHKWFLEAKKDVHNKYHNYYVWAKEPNELKSIFSGSAWEYNEDLNLYYLHLFSKKQPDLNWANENVRKDVKDILNFWIDKGVSGFRFDVIDTIAKEPEKLITSNGKKLHEYIREMAEGTFKDKDLMTVGETWSASLIDAAKYCNPDGSELSMIFQFEHIMCDYMDGTEKWDYKKLDFKKLKATFYKWQTELDNIGWNSLFWGNHDLPRIVSNWGNDKKYRVESAKMLAILLHFMKGTVFIYQGEEIGMTNVKFDTISDYKDVETHNMYKERINNGYSKEYLMNSIYERGRDNARTPMQWDNSNNAGFSDGSPWIKINPNYETINVAEALKDMDSVFYCYKKLIEFRKNSDLSDLILYGDFQLIFADHETVFAYERTYENHKILVVCNFFEKECEVKLPVSDATVVIQNYADVMLNGSTLALRPYEAIIFQLEN